MSFFFCFEPLCYPIINPNECVHTPSINTVLHIRQSHQFAQVYSFWKQNYYSSHVIFKTCHWALRLFTQHSFPRRGKPSRDGNTNSSRDPISVLKNKATDVPESESKKLLTAVHKVSLLPRKGRKKGGLCLSYCLGQCWGKADVSSQRGIRRLRWKSHKNEFNLRIPLNLFSQIELCCLWQESGYFQQKHSLFWESVFSST